MKLVTPDTLSLAIRGSAIRVKADEVVAVLDYVVSGRNYVSLHKLPLIHTVEGSIGQIVCHRSISGQPMAAVCDATATFYLPGTGDAAGIYDLMSISPGRQVRPSSGWLLLSK